MHLQSRLQSSAESRALSWAHLWVCPPSLQEHLPQTLQKQSCKNNQGTQITPVTVFSSQLCHLASASKRDGKNWETDEELLPSGHQAPKLSLITSTGLNLINCNTHHSPSSALLLCVHTRYNLFAHSLHIPGYINIIKSTVDCIAHFSSLQHFTPYFIVFFAYFFFILFLPIFIYTLLCYVSSSFFIFLHCPLSGPVLTYISLLIIPCMIVYVTNKQEPWTLNLLI